MGNEEVRNQFSSKRMIETVNELYIKGDYANASLVLDTFISAYPELDYIFSALQIEIDAKCKEIYLKGSGNPDLPF